MITGVHARISVPLLRRRSSTRQTALALFLTRGSFSDNEIFFDNTIGPTLLTQRREDVKVREDVQDSHGSTCHETARQAQPSFPACCHPAEKLFERLGASASLRQEIGAMAFASGCPLRLIWRAEEAGSNCAASNLRGRGR